MPSSTRWRIYISATPANTFACFSEIAMRASYGGANLCVGGSVTASTTYAGSSPLNAFDGNNSTFWSSNAVPAWIEYQFPSPQIIAELALVSANQNTLSPTSFELQYWDGSAWIPTIIRTGEPAWGAETRIYNKRPKMAWRLLATAGNSSFSGLMDLTLRKVAGGPTVCVGGFPSADHTYSNFFPSNAFDASMTSGWLAQNNASFPYPHHIRYSFTEPQEIIEYKIQAYSPYTPTAFKLQFSDGNNGWTDADTRTAIAWTSGEAKTFTFTPVVTTDPPIENPPPAFSARPQIFVCT